MSVAVARLANGDVLNPVKVSGIGSSRIVLENLEKLRLAIVQLQDEKSVSTSKNQTAIAGMAHDLKTPLAVISGYAESMVAGMTDKDYATLIMEKTQQMSEMVQNIVDAAREETKSGTALSEIVDARKFFLREEDKLCAVAAAKDISFKMNTPPECSLRIERESIARVLQNLVSNAVKYTNVRGKISVKIERHGNLLTVSVTDNGEGIKRKNQRFVFDKFYRESEARTSSNSGLGLYLVKEIVEHHGGKVGVRSKKGKGSTFWFTLPVSITENEKKIPPYSIDAMPRIGKFFLFLFFFYILSPVYRFALYASTHEFSDLMCALLSVPLMPVFGILDIVTTITTNKILLLK